MSLKTTALFVVALLALAACAPATRDPAEPPTPGADPDTPPPPGAEPDAPPPPSDAADPAPPAPARRSASGRLSAEARDILRVHNGARKAVGVPPLKWSARLAKYAQAWANRLARTQNLQHRPNAGPWKQKYGENLAMAGGSNPISRYGATGSKQWLSEKRRYRHGSTSLAGVGHYTQMVWRKTTHMGCGLARFRKGPWHNVILVCNYDPAGNMMGQTPY